MSWWPGGVTRICGANSRLPHTCRKAEVRALRATVAERDARCASVEETAAVGARELEVEKARGSAAQDAREMIERELEDMSLTQLSQLQLEVGGREAAALACPVGYDSGYDSFERSRPMLLRVRACSSCQRLAFRRRRGHDTEG